MLRSHRSAAINAEGKLIQQERLEATGPLRGIELAENQFHSLVALAPNTVMFELKQGPYPANG